ncbi:MAG: hypothetical protein AAB408_00545 [Patescibacteria group bacterium]
MSRERRGWQPPKSEGSDPAGDTIRGVRIQNEHGLDEIVVGEAEISEGRRDLDATIRRPAKEATYDYDAEETVRMPSPFADAQVSPDDTIRRPIVQRGATANPEKPVSRLKKFLQSIAQWIAGK